MLERFKVVYHARRYTSARLRALHARRHKVTFRHLTAQLFALNDRLCHCLLLEVSECFCVCSVEPRRHIASEADERDEDGEEITSCKIVHAFLPVFY